MKVLNVFLVALLCVVSLTVGGCRKRHWDKVYINVPSDPVVTNVVDTTPGGISIVEIVDPNNKWDDAFKARVLADLDYQVLYVWYQREHTPGTVPAEMDFKTWVKSARFHLFIDCNFVVNHDRNVHYAVLPEGFDIYLAVLRQSEDGHYCADASRAMDLLVGEPNNGHDRHPGGSGPLGFPLFVFPLYAPTTDPELYLSLQ